MALPTVYIIALGGTITMVPDSSGGIVPKLTGRALVELVPSLRQIAGIEVETLSLVPSVSLTISDMRRVVARIDDLSATDVAGVVVVQGTDTIDETAFLIDLLHTAPMPVVITGAMRGGVASGADGPANLLAAATVAASPFARGLGALVVMNDEVHCARFAEKLHKSLPSAFGSPNGGRLGVVAEGAFHITMQPSVRPQISFHTAGDAQVAIVKLGLDDDGRLLSVIRQLGYSGVIIEGMGAGHVPGTVVAGIERLAEEIPVLLSSRVPGGAIATGTYGFAGGEMDLIRRGVIPTGYLSPHKARLLLALCLGAGFDRQRIAEAFRSFVTGV